MTKDYFQDILPPHGGAASKPLRPIPPKPLHEEPHEHEEVLEDEERFSAEGQTAELPQDTRSIRNITVSSRAARRPPPPGREMHETDHREPRKKKAGRLWVWMLAILLLTVLGLIFLVALRPTTINVMPRSQVVVFDSSMQFTAYPNNASPGSLSYSVERVDIDDSAVVTAQGTAEAQEKAKGKITIYNNYSAEPVRLIATTRFETPDGLVFRITQDVSVPGKKGTVPGELTVAVEADQPGEKYNIGPVDKFTLPGLKGNAAMYAGVYARSTAPMSGGFVGARPVVSESDTNAARAEIRSRLEQKIREAVASKNTSTTIALADLAHITYESLPTLSEGGNSARIRERATAEIPVFPASALAQAVARGVSADAEQSSVFLRNPSTLKATLVMNDEVPILGSTPIVFTLNGNNQIVWNVDLPALTQALAGKDKGAFEAIVSSFPGIEEARARVQPFWKKSFPTDPSVIQVRLEEPKPLDSF